MQTEIFLLCLIILIVVLKLSCYERNKNTKKVTYMKKDKLSILLTEYEELRNELKQRINQRDGFSIQFILSTIAVMTIACSGNGKYSKIIFLLPVISYYFTEQIFSSYKVHGRLVEFIRENIEKQIANEIKETEPSDTLWESYCAKVRKLEIDNRTGSRKKFFSFINFLMPFISFLIYVGLNGISKKLLLGVIYCLLWLAINIRMMIENRNSHEYIGLNKLSFADYVDAKPRTDEKTKAIFFDRDGTLHVDKVMTHKCRDLELLPGAKEIVKKAHKKGYRIIIVTNQSAIGKGYYSSNQMHRFNKKLRRKLKYIDAIYYCPHTADVHCKCRKPNTGMFERAVKEFNINLGESIIIGDRMSDIKAGNNAGVGRKVFVTTGIYGEGGYMSEDGFHDIEHETVNSLLDIEI